jgi:hypothetical protein
MESALNSDSFAKSWLNRHRRPQRAGTRRQHLVVVGKDDSAGLADLVKKEIITQYSLSKAVDIPQASGNRVWTTAILRIDWT